jgi:hypothetical protein
VRTVAQEGGFKVVEAVRSQPGNIRT